MQIGKFAVPMDRALTWVAEYTNGDANRVSESPYAYPAYDTYQAGENSPNVLTDADLLAPVLLNVTVKIRSFYALQGVREELQKALSEPELAQPLADLSDERIGDLIGALYSVLDVGLWDVQGTKLSKILHRKRPSSVALHDIWVRACYVGPDGPVLPAARGERSWSEYMSAVSQAMGHDLRDGADQFKELQAVSGAQPALSDLRLLDILAWNVGRRGAATF